MIKRIQYLIWLLLLPLLLIWLLSIGVALAGNPTDVITINAYGYIVASPSNLVLTKVSDHQIDVSWVKGWDAANTMVRAKYGVIPTDVGDGYQVYYGAGSSASDFSVNLELSDSTIYYKAWSQRVDGVYEGSIFGIYNSIRGVGMVLIAFLLLALIPTVISFIVKNGKLALTILGMIGWILLGAYSYTLSTTIWDIYYDLFVASIGMTLITGIIIVASLLSKDKDDSDEEDDDDGYTDHIKALEDEDAKIDKMMGPRRRKARVHTSSFAKSGVDAPRKKKS
jgi:hypothetical protein